MQTDENGLVTDLSLADLGDVPTEHLLPLPDNGHTINQHEECRCKPFVYLRIQRAGDGAALIGAEVRHNAFDALPVDEEALEVAQGRRSALEPAEGHS